MSELKPCCKRFKGTCYTCTSYIKYYEFCPICGQPLTEPKPLTLDELKEREGKPVWIVPINLYNWICDTIDGKPDWGMVRKSWARIWRQETADLVHTDFDFEDYGKTWLAFDREVEGET